MYTGTQITLHAFDHQIVARRPTMKSHSNEDICVMCMLFRFVSFKSTFFKHFLFNFTSLSSLHSICLLCPVQFIKRVGHFCFNINKIRTLCKKETSECNTGFRSRGNTFYCIALNYEIVYIEVKERNVWGNEFGTYWLYGIAIECSTLLCIILTPKNGYTFVSYFVSVSKFKTWN